MAATREEVGRDERIGRENNTANGRMRAQIRRAQPADNVTFLRRLETSPSSFKLSLLARRSPKLRAGAAAAAAVAH